MTLQKFNDKDLLRNIRTNVLNPMVDQTNANTADVNTLKTRVSSVDKRLGFLEPEVTRNTTNLSALNRLAQGVAQQVSMAYDSNKVDYGNKLVTFTTLGGVESTLNLAPMFIDPIRTTISIKGPADNNYHEMSRLDFEGNVGISYNNEILGSETATITIEPMKGKINGGNSETITEIEIKGNTGGSTLANKKLTINIPSGGSGGTSNSLFIDPNPLQKNVNLFEGTTKAVAEAARDTYFATAAADLATYDVNIFKVILLEWDNGSSSSGDKLLEFQCRHNSSWVNPFHFDFSTFAIGRHSINELSDGNRVTVLESNTINSVTSLGVSGTDLYELEGGRKLKLKKLKSENVHDLTVITSGTNEVSLRTNPHWRGYYNSPADASTNIQSQDRVTNKTTIITKNAQTQDSIHVWDGANWAEKKISEHGLIAPDNVNWDTLKGLKHGAHISFTKDGNGYHTIEALSPVTCKVNGGTSERINSIEVSNKFAELGNGVLKLPVISAMDQDSANMGQIKNIKQGDNVTFEYDDSTGFLTIKSSISDPIKSKVGALGQEKNLTKIIEPNTYSTITDNGELTLHSVNLVDTANADKGYIKSFKAGKNVTLIKGGDGVLEISNEGMLKGKVINETGETQLKQVEQITFKSDACCAVWTGNNLELDVRGFPAGASSLEELQTKFPITSNAYRHGYLGNTKEVYFAHVSGGTNSSTGEWKLHNYYGMADQVKSLFKRYPELIGETPGAYDGANPMNGVSFVTRNNCPISTPEYREYGIIQNFVASKTKRSQMFYGLESGNTWYRIMKPSALTGDENEFMEWNLLNGLSEDYYSVMTTPSLKLDNKNLISGTQYIPWMVMQDPRCNVSIDGGSPDKFRVNKSGKYDVTVCIHITAKADTYTPSGASYTIALMNADTGQLVSSQLVTGVTVPQSEEYNAGMYPPVRVTFKDVTIPQVNKYSIKVTMSRASEIKNGYLDSFKNYLVVQPSSSNTKQGTVIADNWRTTLGGFSCKDGYEVHVESVSSNPKNVRVYGAVINDNLHNV